MFSLLDLEMPKNTNFITFENIRKEKTDRRYIYVIPIYDKKSLLIVKINDSREGQLVVILLYQMVQCLKCMREFL